LRVWSTAFGNGEQIPARHTCDGEDVSPLIEWDDAPAGAMSFVVLCDDPDAPAGTWHHWGVFDVPTDMGGLAEGYPEGAQVGATRQAVNDFGKFGYGGPCPPRGHGTHRYRFRVLALDVETLDPGDEPRCAQLEAAARPHLIAESETVGLYSRPG